MAGERPAAGTGTRQTENPSTAPGFFSLEEPGYRVLPVISPGFTYQGTEKNI